MKKIKLLDIIVDVKRKAVEQPDEKPLHILASSIKNSFESGSTGLKNHDVSNIRQTIYRTRRRTFRSVPKQRRSCLRRLKEMASSGDEIVRSVRGNIVMIARKEDLKLLNVDRLALFGDGTFKYSPRFFNQMYTFFVFTNGFYIPVAHFLLINKSQATYSSMLNMLKTECMNTGFSLTEKLKGGTIMLDFEQAMISSAKRAFPGCKIQGCRFHLCQNWWRKMKSLGLSQRYKQASSPEGRWLRGVFGLPLLPGIMIEKTFNIYCQTAAGRSPVLLSFQQYLKQTYIKSLSNFEISMWADIDGPSTNNGAESFHRHFGDLFGYLKSKPTIWHFLRNMGTFNVIKSIKMSSQKKVRVLSNDNNKVILAYLRKKCHVSTLLGQLSLRNLPKCALRRKAKH